MKFICSQSHDCQSCSMIVLRIDLELGLKVKLANMATASEIEGDFDRIDGDFDEIDGDLEGRLVVLTRVEVDDDEESLPKLWLVMVDMLLIVGVVDIPGCWLFCWLLIGASMNWLD